MWLPVDRWVKRFIFLVHAAFGLARSPNHVSLDITRNCNLRCRMCFYYGGEDRHGRRLQELSSQEIISRVVNRLEGVDYDITGGEPLMRSDLVEILKAIRLRKANCFLTTNGTMVTPELAKRIIGEDLLRGIHFSLHGLKETHEGITQVKNSFDRTLKGIEYILTQRTQRGINRPEVTIACTIMGSNMKDAEGLAKLADEIKVDRLSFGHASFMPADIQHHHQKVMGQLGLPVESNYDDLVQGPPEIPVAREDLEAYIQFLSQVRYSPGGSKIRTSPEGYGAGDIRRHFLDMNWKFKTSCNYPWRNLRIGPDGTVTPCVGYIVGNVRDQDIREMWNDWLFRKFRSALYRQRLFPGCVRCCKLK